VFFSFTFGGECLSLAAALATMKKLQRDPVIGTMKSRGKKLMDGVRELIARHGAGHIFEMSGHPAWSFLLVKDVPPYTQWQIKTLFLQEVFARGILTLGTHNISYAHSDSDVDRLLDVYDEVFPVVKEAVGGRALDSFLRCRPLEPLFKIR
jgi:glutamate-1-semialdehyde 2,1-aminomutase